MRPEGAPQESSSQNAFTSSTFRHFRATSFTFLFEQREIWQELLVGCKRRGQLERSDRSHFPQYRPKAVKHKVFSVFLVSFYIFHRPTSKLLFQKNNKKLFESKKGRSKKNMARALAYIHVRRLHFAISRPFTFCESQQKVVAHAKSSNGSHDERLAVATNCWKINIRFGMDVCGSDCEQTMESINALMSFVLTLKIHIYEASLISHTNHMCGSCVALG